MHEPKDPTAEVTSRPIACTSTSNSCRGHELTPDPEQARLANYAIVISRYNPAITQKLLRGAEDRLLAAGVPASSVSVAWVPGAWEIPLVADRLARSQEFDAILCLGAVIRGETSHDQHINRQVSLSLGEISLRQGIPILFGILTCENLEQAIHRSGGNVGNKGEECATAALEMVALLKQLDRTFVQSQSAPRTLAQADTVSANRPPA